MTHLDEHRPSWMLRDLLLGMIAITWLAVGFVVLHKLDKHSNEVPTSNPAKEPANWRNSATGEPSYDLTGIDDYPEDMLVVYSKYKEIRLHGYTCKETGISDATHGPEVACEPRRSAIDWYVFYFPALTHNGVALEGM